MATWDDVRRHAAALPEVAEAPSHGGARAWRARKKLFVWERPLRRRDLADLGWVEQPGPVLGVVVADMGVKEALLSGEPHTQDEGVYFTTPHFDRHASVLVHLERIDDTELGELIVEAWFAAVPKGLARRLTERKAPGLPPGPTSGAPPSP